jgi:predicted metallopeptidase
MNNVIIYTTINKSENKARIYAVRCAIKHVRLNEYYVILLCIKKCNLFRNSTWFYFIILHIHIRSLIKQH